MKLKRLFRNTIYNTSKFVTKSYIGANLYHSFISFLKKFPDKSWKGVALNVIIQGNWDSFNFPSKKVIVGNVPLNLVPHAEEFDFTAILYRDLPYEIELYKFLEREIQNYDIVIDIGANVGLFSLYASKKIENKEGVVYAFEPSPEAFRRLLNNRHLNNAYNLKPFNLAIGDQLGFIDFFEPRGHLTNGSFLLDFAKIWDKNPVITPVFTTTPNMMKQLVDNNKKCLIKIDTEGYEAPILIAMKDFIIEQKPSIIIEVLSDYEEAINALDFLKQNYRFYSIEDEGLVEKIEIKAHPSFRDYFLTPK